ncbi:pimeloyl-ACP methyl ester carboxylesterase [Povalibacter uvarum]|uniref:Pimeloyl-ACP methyl ester carboxylesterase n=1 Tax=Povalibacter uvarum TaxID=732238 RepID=A0A841HK38_9GAMM|nr:alpha/beta hydrolase [Povalibacter uvarum]MBB6092944.1 pimeloyl-ACP methyl ester carboxylesterase [Povalibacter uvarum]
MKKRRRFHTAFSCAAAGLLLASGFAAGAAGPIDWTECGIDGAMGGTASARCGWMEVPENRDDPASRGIRLRVTVIPALRLQPEKDALVILAGGPGQAANDVYASASGAFAAIRRDRDIVLVDQRGTGQSNALNCAFDDDAEILTTASQQLQDAARQCLATLQGDPRFYTTSVAVRDLDDVRAALGYEAFSIYSVSYGTRVAQHYLRRYPSRVRAAILDGAVPVDLALGPDIALRAQNALDSVFQHCADDKLCAKAFPSVKEQFDALRARLQRQPLQVKLPDPLTAQVQQTSFGPMQLNAAVRLLTYSDETASLLPLLIHQAQTAQQPEPMVAQYMMVKRSMEQALSYGMHFAVVCSEDAPRWDLEKVSTASLDATYLGASFMVGMRAVCDIWPRGIVDDDFNAPLKSDAPVLILSGSNDPVTPAEYGQRALASYPNGRHLVLAGQGHGQFATGCMPRVLAAFVRGGTTAVETKCLDGVKPAPFMLSFTGAGP